MDCSDNKDFKERTLRTLKQGLGRLWKRRSVTITEYDPSYKVVYLGNVLTGWAKGKIKFTKYPTYLLNSFTTFILPPSHIFHRVFLYLGYTKCVVCFKLFVYESNRSYFFCIQVLWFYLSFYVVCSYYTVMGPRKLNKSCFQTTKKDVKGLQTCGVGVAR